MKKYILLVGILVIGVLGIVGMYTFLPIASIDENENTTDESLPPMVINEIKAPIIKVNISLDTKIPNVPNEMMVYKTRKIATKEYAIEIGKKFGLQEDVREDEKNFYVIDKPFELQVYKPSGAIWYADMSRMYGNEKNPKLPSESEAVDIAKKFLSDRDLMSGAIFDKIVVDTKKKIILDPNTNKTIYKEEPYDIQVFFRYEIDSVPIVGGSKLKVYIGNNGDVIGVFKVKRNYESWKSFKIRTPNEALRILKERGIHSVKIPIKEAKVKGIYLAYYE
ncbi:MAG: hypothetical protein K6348_03825, partial [Deferribacterales bacterium]